MHLKRALLLLPWVSCTPVLLLAGDPGRAGRVTQVAPVPSMEDAETCFMAHDLKGASAVWEQLAAAPGTRPEDRAEAQRWLARLDWWFHARPDAARARLLKAAEAGTAVPRLLCELAELEISLARYAQARVAAQKAIQAAARPRERRDAQVWLAQATVTEAQEASLSSRAVPNPRQLSEAVVLLQELQAREPGVLAIARPLFAAALMQGNGATAWKAWQSYYHVVPGAGASDLLRKPMAVLQELLPAWKGGPMPTAKAAAFVQALTDSRFFPEAAAFLRDPARPESLRASFSQLLAYHEFTRTTRAVTEDYYRNKALGKDSREAYRRRLGEELRTRWTRLGLPGQAGSKGDVLELGEAAFPVLRARYGSVFHFGWKGGQHFSLTLGHLLADDRWDIEQYGRKAQVHRRVVGAMVCFDFRSWARCFEDVTGGWVSSAEPGVLNVVRHDVTAMFLAEWQRATEPRARKDWDAEIARESAEDEHRATRNPHAYLPGLEERLQRDAADRIAAELDRKGIRDSEARILAYIAFREQEFEEGTCAHEGRHIIDAALGIADVATKEARAKLSEIAFAGSPKAAFSSIFSSTLGIDSSHGQGGLTLVKGLVAWMEAHRAEIQGFEASRPTLPQLDRLTDEQLREAARSLDPLHAEAMKQAAA